MPRITIGYVVGQGGRFDRVPFYMLRLPLAECKKLDELLAAAGADLRHTATLTASFHQPDRLRVTEIGPPKYELQAAAHYVRGDVIRVQGKEGVSCGLDISARFGIPLVREQLSLAQAGAREFVEFRVPSRKRDIIELIPDTERGLTERDVIVAGSMAAAVSLLPPEDFSDWVK